MKTKKPNRLVLFACYLFAWLYFKTKYNIKVFNKQILKEIKGPFIFLCNHENVMDPAFLVGAAYPTNITFVGSYALFQKRFLGWLVRRLAVIPKFQYQMDFDAIKKMVNVTKNGGVLGLFPAGRLPSCGAGFPIPEAVSKLVKMCKVPVVWVDFNGSYLSKPKWANGVRKGELDVTFNLLFTKEQVESISTQEMNNILNEKLAFNDYEWNRDKQIEFKGKDLAVGLETTLYHCPKCHKEFEMETEDNELRCKHCGLTFKIKATGFFEENEYYEHPQQWYEDQRQYLIKEIEEKDILMSDGCEVIGVVDGKDAKIGEGEVSLDKDKITLKGLLKGEEVVKELSIVNLFSLPYRAGVNIEIADGNDIYIFHLKHGVMAAKWSQLVEEIYKLR
jgi:1-acyl-sn-glycerol-3-phosphate acyltransferase